MKDDDVYDPRRFHKEYIKAKVEALQAKAARKRNLAEDRSDDSAGPPEPTSWAQPHRSALDTAILWITTWPRVAVVLLVIAVLSFSISSLIPPATKPVQPPPGPEPLTLWHETSGAELEFLENMAQRFEQETRRPVHLYRLTNMELSLGRALMLEEGPDILLVGEDTAYRFAENQFLLPLEDGANQYLMPLTESRMWTRTLGLVITRGTANATAARAFLDLVDRFTTGR